MTSNPALRRCLALAGAAGVFAVILGLPARDHSAPTPLRSGRSWPMWGGTPQRNMVNLGDRKVPIQWKVDEGKEEHIKWVVELGDAANAGPVIADGLVWTIGADNAVHGLDPATGRQVVSIPYGGSANHFPTPTAADGLLLLPGVNQVVAFMGPAGRPAAPTAS